MSSDDPYDCIATGSLKVKGSSAGKLKKGKKKRKKNKAEEIVGQAVDERSNILDDEGFEETTPTVRKTAAELAFQKYQEKRDAERILKKASKTHKQRVEDLNEYLGKLSEHYDIQKVSWTK